MANCVECGEFYSPKRLALGYKTCLDCGEAEASKEKKAKGKQIAPAYNKGAYMYITNKEMVNGIHRK